MLHAAEWRNHHEDRRQKDSDSREPQHRDDAKGRSRCSGDKRANWHHSPDEESNRGVHATKQVLRAEALACADLGDVVGEHGEHADELTKAENDNRDELARTSGNGRGKGGEAH